MPTLRKLVHGTLHRLRGTRRLDDEFLEWLGFANAGMQHPGNASCFDHALSRLPSQAPMVEIGVFCGLSTNTIAYLKAKHGRSNPVFTCDPWIFEGAGSSRLGGHGSLTHADYRRYVMDSFQRNVRFFSGADLPHALEATSDDFFRRWAAGEATTDLFGRPARLGGPVSFAYIDGDHRYEQARRDFDNVDRFLEPGGFILFDDSADESEWEVRKVILELKASGRYRVVLRNPNYLVQKLP
jgi:hypothetical protein